MLDPMPSEWPAMLFRFVRPLAKFADADPAMQQLISDAALWAWDRACEERSRKAARDVVSVNRTGLATVRVVRSAGVPLGEIWIGRSAAAALADPESKITNVATGGGA